MSIFSDIILVLTSLKNVQTQITSIAVPSTTNPPAVLPAAGHPVLMQALTDIEAILSIFSIL
jgi:hypothetical protein